MVCCSIILSELRSEFRNVKFEKLSNIQTFNERFDSQLGTFQLPINLHVIWLRLFNYHEIWKFSIFFILNLSKIDNFRIYVQLPIYRDIDILSERE